ncbi:MAG: DUF4919 domain-containing protein [Bacteroidetes bacterium]|nr:DUF4919 domain-containing protein [Bacteroidota bacterium]
MCRTIFLLALFLLPVALFAQGDDDDYKVPDYASINEMTHDPNSAFYYPKLMQRYHNNDTTLSLREYAMLYYGYPLQKQYNPLTGFEIEDENIRKIFSQDELHTEDLRNIVQESKNYLEKFPFDLKKLNLVYIASKELGDSTTQNVYLEKIRKIALTILSTGDGLHKETAFHVISLPDEYAMIKMLGYQYEGSAQLAGNNCSYLGIATNSDQIGGFYFNAKPVFEGIPQAIR